LPRRDVGDMKTGRYGSARAPVAFVLLYAANVANILRHGARGRQKGKIALQARARADRARSDENTAEFQKGDALVWLGGWWVSGMAKPA